MIRIVQLGFNQLRDALFARVGQYAVRILAYRTFVHMHELSLRFHLERRTGGLSRVIERGVKGIETIVRFTMLATAPTILEFALTAGIFAFAYGWLYVVVIAVTVWLYIWFTVRASNWRISIRREMNEVRHRRQHQGDRIRCSTSRRSNISTTRRWRPSASTARWRATRLPPQRPGPRSAG